MESLVSKTVALMTKLVWHFLLQLAFFGIGWLS